MIISRRGLITGLVGIVAAPAIVRASSIMRIKPWESAEALVFPDERAIWELSDIIARITPVDTPLYFGLNKGFGDGLFDVRIDEIAP